MDRGQGVKLAEHLGGVAEWPTSRKIMLLGVPGIAATCAAGLVNATAHGWVETEAINVSLVNHYIAVWVLAQLLSTLVCVPAAIAGREARWTAYLFVAVQCPFTAGLLWLFGTMATPLVAIFPAIVILWTMYLGPRYGAFGLVNMGVWILVAMIADASEALPYAPALLIRDIAAQRSLLWSSALFMHILVLGAFCLALCIFNLRSQGLQAQRLKQMHGALERSNRVIRRYVPAQLAEQILSGAHDEASRPQRRKLTIVFVDVEGFTSLSESVAPDVLAAVLDVYLSEMVAIADRYAGTINQIVGDGIMVFFGAPEITNDQDHALRAVQMAQTMQERMLALGPVWRQHRLDKPLRIRIGINTGHASVGDFGPAGRKLYSGIGFHTNLAARVQSHCEPGQVLLTEKTWALVRDRVACSYEGELCIRGLQRPVRVYELREPAAIPIGLTLETA